MFKMNLELRRNGRSVSPQEFARGLAEDAQKAAEDEIERRLRRIRDPETGRLLVVRKRRVGSKMEWDLEGSPAAIEHAKRVLNGGSR
jgi:hypothetical protein